MWLFTKTGFYSVVQKKGEEGLQVRARVEKDLITLKEKYMPELTDPIYTVGDYAYRSFISHADFANGMARVGEDIHYDNFKNTIGKIDIARAHIYSNIWYEGLALNKVDANYHQRIEKRLSLKRMAGR